MKRLERARVQWDGYTLLEPMEGSETSSDFYAHFDDGSGPSRPCVVRVVDADLARTDRFSHRFQSAAEVAMRLEHPHLVRVLEHGHRDGELFLATEYVVGTSLRVIHDRLHGESKRLPTPCVVSIGLLVASALHRLDAGARGRPLVHGDIRLERLFVSSTGDIKLGDFCIEDAMRSANDAALRAARTRRRLRQKAGHLSVEQLLNERLDGRTDQYSLGAVLFELLTGRAPYHRPDSASTAAAVLGATPPQVHLTSPDIPEDLAAIIDRTLARRPEQRFPSPAALYAELEKVAARFDTVSAVALLGGLAHGLHSARRIESQGRPTASANWDRATVDEHTGLQRGLAAAVALEGNAGRLGDNRFGPRGESIVRADDEPSTLLPMTEIGGLDLEGELSALRPVARAEDELSALRSARAEGELSSLRSARAESELSARAESELSSLRSARAESELSALRSARAEGELSALRSARAESELSVLRSSRAESEVSALPASRAESELSALQSAAESELSAVRSARAESGVSALRSPHAESELSAVRSVRTEGELSVVGPGMRPHTGLGVGSMAVPAKAPASAAGSAATMIWISLITTVTVVSLFMWAWVLSQ